MVGLSSPKFLRRLKSSLNVKLYMSDISRILLLNDPTYQHLSPYLDILPVDQSTVIEVPNGNGDMDSKVVVTFLPAGHCPGSVMIFLEGMNGTVLYTGDFRWGVGDAARYSALYHSFSQVKDIQSIYVDTTFCFPEAMYIPSRDESFEAVKSLVQWWLNNDTNRIIYFRCSAQFGYEYIFIKLYQALNMKVHVNHHTLANYSGIPEIEEALTINHKSTKLHACYRRCKVKEDIKTSMSYLPCCYQSTGYSHMEVLTIKLCAMWYAHHVALQNIKYKVGQTFYRVCYSMHSSLSEIQDLIRHLKPVNVYPNVVPKGSTASKVIRWLQPFCRSSQHQQHYSEQSASVHIPLKNLCSSKHTKNIQFWKKQIMLQGKQECVSCYMYETARLSSQISESSSDTTDSQHTEKEKPNDSLSEYSLSSTFSESEEKPQFVSSEMLKSSSVCSKSKEFLKRKPEETEINFIKTLEDSSVKLRKTCSSEDVLLNSLKIPEYLVSESKKTKLLEESLFSSVNDTDSVFNQKKSREDLMSESGKISDSMFSPKNYPGDLVFDSRMITEALFFNPVRRPEKLGFNSKKISKYFVPEYTNMKSGLLFNKSLKNSTFTSDNELYVETNLPFKREVHICGKGRSQSSNNNKEIMILNCSKSADGKHLQLGNSYANKCITCDSDDMLLCKLHGSDFSGSVKYSKGKYISQKLADREISFSTADNVIAIDSSCCSESIIKSCSSVERDFSFSLSNQNSKQCPILLRDISCRSSGNCTESPVLSDVSSGTDDDSDLTPDKVWPVVTDPLNVNEKRKLFKESTLPEIGEIPLITLDETPVDNQLD
ncbi:uncharacterized protein LOC143253048 isoform X3 [Tachypleus tridentatus]